MLRKKEITEPVKIVDAEAKPDQRPLWQRMGWGRGWDPDLIAMQELLNRYCWK